MFHFSGRLKKMPLSGIGCVGTGPNLDTAECDGGAGAGGAAGGSNLGLSGPVGGGNSCEQNSPFTPVCATSNSGNGNGGSGAPGGAGGYSIGGNGGNVNDVFGGTDANGASACETTASCIYQN